MKQVKEMLNGDIEKGHCHMGWGAMSRGDCGEWWNTGAVEAEALIYGLSHVTVFLDMAWYGGWDLDLLPPNLSGNSDLELDLLGMQG